MAGQLEDYALIGDLQTCALVGRDGAIDWLCLPRFDSPACFAALVDCPDAGNWRIAPAAGGTAGSRRYRGDSLVLENDWSTPTGRVRVIDFMPIRGSAADVVRIVEGLSGRVSMRSELRLRFDYGSSTPWVTLAEGKVSAIAGPDAVHVFSGVAMQMAEGVLTVDFEIEAGDRVPFVLTWSPSYEPEPWPVEAEEALQDTEAFWTRWISRCTYQGEWESAVRRSLVTLKALTYAPTGGILAAATTSLPENLGGTRNWDYRYCWLRDASLTLQALMRTGFVEEAQAWRDWLLRAAAGDPARLQIMYALDGGRRLPEQELPWLSGYQKAAPVRIGNAAVGQYQLDVWGEVLDGLHVGRQSGLAPLEDAWDLQLGLMEFLEGHWDRPDNGIWEVRGPRRHFVHSKVMAWAGVDRMIQAAERHGLEGPLDRWRALRSQIHRDVCDNGYDRSRGTFTQYYGGSELDAALLMIPRVGFLPWSDGRVSGTVRAVENELMEGDFLRRYRAESGVDGLPGGEATFIACNFWLVDALQEIGRGGDARGLFERLLGVRNDLGLLSEQWDPIAGRQVGNFPQAFSHESLVNSAMALSAGGQTTTRAGAPDASAAQPA